jgi:predicted nucleotidyltransferase
MKLSRELKDKIVSFLSNKLDLELLIIFGSYAKGQANNNSDIDLAYLSSHDINPADKWGICQSLARELNIDVDLVDLKHANDVLSFQIISQGIIIYQKNNDSIEIEKYLDNVYSRYMQLNQDRKEILDNYAR